RLVGQTLTRRAAEFSNPDGRKCEQKSAACTPADTLRRFLEKSGRRTVRNSKVLHLHVSGTPTLHGPSSAAPGGAIARSAGGAVDLTGRAVPQSATGLTRSGATAARPRAAGGRQATS